jgi:putative DNA primase/helicase
VNGLLDVALAWHDAGVCTLPAADDGSKRPAVPWQQYQQQRPTPAQVMGWFAGDQHDGLGAVCGAVSGGLEMFELEGRAVTDGLHEQLVHLLMQADPELLTNLMSYLERTPGGGLHWIFRVEGAPVRGNTKLARRRVEPSETNPTGIEVLIETRGEGGWTILGGSGGRTHPSGMNWEILSGRPGEIPTLTADQYATLHRVARTFDEMPEAVPPPAAPPEPRTSGERTPGDEFNERTTWEEILRPAGWTPVGHRGDVTLWRRPGKQHGISATTGYGDGDWLYVFTTSTTFESERTYTKFGAHALLQHGGDYAAASKALRRAGYGDPLPTETVMTLLHGEGNVTDEKAPAGGAETHQVNVTQVTASFTDDGNAQLLIAEHAHRLRYVPERGHWLTWNGTRWAWAADESPAIQAMLATIRAIQPADNAQAKWKTRSLNYRPLQQAIHVARTDPAMQAPIDRLDADPYALNTPTGVVDLRTGRLSESRPEHLHTRLTGAPYDPAADYPDWQKFLNDTFGDDEALTSFVQRVVGYSISGVVTHHILPFCHGSGGNGKSVFIETVLRVIGDYGTTAPPDFLLAGGRDDEAAVARLTGQRLVVCSEVNPSAKFNEARIKHLTGGDTITARFLYGQHFTFQPTHKLWLLGNHQPRVDAGGDSFWRRLRLVPFLRTVAAENVIVDLAERLARNEGPGILAWIVAGARLALAGGLREPEAVLAATAQYAEEEDTLRRFADERLHVGGGDLVRIEMRELRSAYEQWCFVEGEKPLTTQMFGRELRGRFGIGMAKSHGRRFYTNVALLNPDRYGASRTAPIREGSVMGRDGAGWGASGFRIAPPTSGGLTRTDGYGGAMGRVLSHLGAPIRVCACARAGREFQKSEKSRPMRPQTRPRDGVR